MLLLRVLQQLVYTWALAFGVCQLTPSWGPSPLVSWSLSAHPCLWLTQALPWPTPPGVSVVWTEGLPEAATAGLSPVPGRRMHQGPLSSWGVLWGPRPDRTQLPADPLPRAPRSSRSAPQAPLTAVHSKLTFSLYFSPITRV